MADSFMDMTTEAAVLPASSSSSSSSSLPGTRIFRIYGLVTGEVIGLILNCVTIFIFLRTPLRNSGVYLLALAFADNVALLAELIRWFSSSMYMGLHWMDESNALCKIVNIMRYGARLYSSFITVTITIERYLAVAHPFKAAPFLRRKTSKIVVLVELVVSLILSSYCLFLFELTDPTNGHAGCSIKSKNSLLYSRFNWIVSKAIGEIATSIAVFLFSILIMHALLKARKFRKQSAQGGDKNKASTVDYQLTFMLFLVSTVFFIFRTPYTINYYISHNRRELFGGTAAYLALVKYRTRRASDVTFVFYTWNHSVNFFLYCLSGTKFRGYLKMAFGCQQEAKPTKTSVMSLSNSNNQPPSAPKETEAKTAI